MSDKWFYIKMLHYGRFLYGYSHEDVTTATEWEPWKLNESQPKRPQSTEHVLRQKHVYVVTGTIKAEIDW